ncbi:MAG: hypothetical protein IJI05_02285, partial [Erysipelotrichaceae bacterium]|nr:hypothetical protein [Erysipelotrichaceae bacterium]
FAVLLRFQIIMLFDEVDDIFIKQEGVRLNIRSEEKPDDDYKPVLHRKPVDVHPGDIMVHEDFGEGVVISVNGNFGDIAFPYPYMTKTMSLNFPKLHKKEKKDE